MPNPPNTSEPVLSGRCFCQAFRYRVTGPVRSLCFCHCESCRRATGSVCVAWGTVAPSRFEVTRGQLTTLHSSKGVERGFCGACGTHVTYRHEARPGDVDFTLTSLDDPSALSPQRHVWLEDKLPWLEIGDRLPRYPTVAGAGNG